MATPTKRAIVNGCRYVIQLLAVVAAMMSQYAWLHFLAGAMAAIIVFETAGRYVVAQREKRYAKWFADAYTTEIVPDDEAPGV